MSLCAFNINRGSILATINKSNYCAVTAAQGPWNKYNISIEPWNPDRSTWPANFDPRTFGFGYNNLLLVNSAFTDQAGDNVAIHTLERQFSNQIPNFHTVAYDIRIDMRDGSRFLALQ